MLNKKWFAGLIFILLILTVSAVNAEDSLSADISDSNEQTLITDESDKNLLISDEDNEKLPTDNEYSAKILNDADIGSFDDLASEIEKIEDGGVLNLSKDYKYASGSSDGILLNKSITINGNNHTIDGNGQSRIFNISKNNITLNDLILVNGNHNIGGAIFSFKPIVCNNLIFENNHATNAGAIYTSNGLKLYNCIFDGNPAKDGAAIFIDTNYAEDDDETFPDEEYPYEETSPNEETNPNDEYTNDEYSDEEYPDEEYLDDEDYDPFPFLIENSIFKNNHNSSRGLIFSQTLETVKIINATFANSTAEYGAAIFGEKGSEFYIYNSSFTDLHASISGGALLLVSFSKGIIENCSFINTSAKSNGGSICNSVFCTGIYETTTPLEINNCEFKNSESGYGGVISQAGGLLNISNSLFEGNNAIHSGGAIYAAFCGLNISNSTFNDNKLNYTDFESNGGAINVFYGNISVDSSKFNDNTKNAIYFVEGGYEIKNSLFNNNKRQFTAHMRNMAF